MFALSTRGLKLWGWAMLGAFRVERAAIHAEERVNVVARRGPMATSASRRRM